MGIPVPTSDMQWDNCLLLFVAQVKRHRKRENQHIHSLAKPLSPDPKMYQRIFVRGFVSSDRPPVILIRKLC